MPYRVVYDPQVVEIEEYVMQLQTVMDTYNIAIALTELDNLHDLGNSGSGYTDIYITCAESENFHNKVRRKFVEACDKCYIVLLYPAEGYKEVHRVMKRIKSQLKKLKLSPGDVENALDRVIKITDIENVSSWWPKVLCVVCQPGQRKPDREIGVYFKIDIDDEEQMNWCIEQRKVLEEQFKLSCRYDDGAFPEVEYIKHAMCCVVYVPSGVTMTTEAHPTDVNIECKVRNIVQVCQDCNTMCQIYVDNARLSSRLVEADGLEMVGSDGLLSYWIGLLNLLDLGKWLWIMPPWPTRSLC